MTKSNNQKTTTIGDDTIFNIEGVLDSELVYENDHKLVYENDPTLDIWVPLSDYTDLGDTVSLSCKTEKDKDRRTHR